MNDETPYPVLSALPNAMPTPEICRKVIDIVRKTRVAISRILVEERQS